MVAVHAHLVVSAPQDSSKPIANIVLKAIAEEPRLCVRTSSSTAELQDDDGVGRSGDLSLPLLDYGVLVGGSSSSLQLKLANQGSCSLPLCLSITAKVRDIPHYSHMQLENFARNLPPHSVGMLST